VSIVLPTHNGSRYLAESLESCLTQTHEHWELIVVDDCSLDGTQAIIKRYAERDGRIRSVRHQANRKLPAALNTGFSLARGDFLTWTSDDNRYRPDALKTLADALMTHRDFDIVYSDWSYIDRDGIVAERRRAFEPRFLPYENCVMYSFLYSRGVQDALGGYDEERFLVEDYDFWLRASRSFRFLCIHQDLFLARKHESRLSALHPRGVKRATMRLLEAYLSEKGRQAGSRALARLRIAAEAASLGERRAAWHHLLSAAKTSPRSFLNERALPAVTRLLAGKKGTEVLKRLYRRAYPASR
jgi:glycosyltransferase involved in cell wall biosynthesis